jgi:GTPase involved in cell partitioning and DNA repair
MRLDEMGFLLKIIKTYVFYDKKSIFKEIGFSTSGEEKNKLKLFLKKNEILEQYIFIVSTSNDKTCNNNHTIKILPNEWETVFLKWVSKKTSYLNIRNIDVLTEKQLLEKYNDNQNRFQIAAKVKNEHIETLTELYKKSREYLEKQNSAISSVADFALLDIDLNNYAIDSLKAIGLI